MGMRYSCALLLCLLGLFWPTVIHAEDTKFQFDPETEPPPVQEQKKAPTPEEQSLVRKKKKPKKGWWSKNTLMLGAGYATQHGFLTQARIASRDLFGVEGLHLSMNTMLSGGAFDAEIYTGYDSRKKPWMVDLSLYVRQTNLSGMGWDEGLLMLNMGGKVRVGWKWGNGWRVILGYRMERHSMKQADILDNVPNYVVTPPGGWERPRLLSAMSIQLEYATPQKAESQSEFHEGWNFQLGAEGSASFLGSDYRYAKLNASLRLGINLPLGLHLALEAKAGMLFGNNTPFTERFQLGGVNGRSVMPVLGPQIANTNGVLALGGQGMLHTRAILYVPIVPKIRISLFGGVEAGVLLYKDRTLHNRAMQVSWNGSAVFGIRWRSPIGPLNFTWGIPLLAPPGEPRQLMFTFGIGGSF